MSRFIVKIVASIAALALLPLIAVLLTSAPATSATWRLSVDSSLDATDNLDEFENRVLAKINNRRARKGKRKIRLYDTCLDRFSEDWSRHLAGTGLFEHRDQGTVLRTCRKSWVGENLARGSAMKPGMVVRAWWKSPTHRAVMMKRRANRAGLAVTRDANGAMVVVLNLGDSS